MAEYLRGFRTERIAGIDYRDMVRRRKAIAPRILALELADAQEYLTSEPGPNLRRRQELAPGWFGDWIDLLNDLPDAGQLLVDSRKIMPLEEVSAAVGERKGKSGVLFVAAAEGHPGHIQAARHMCRYLATTIWLFEPESYMANKLRGESFLSLEARLSMWNYFFAINILSVSPERPPTSVPNDHYQGIFNQTRARYCFTTADDPNLLEKIQRGEPANFLIIPRLDVSSTSDRVEKLFG